ncbi:MAG: hypothetical protein AB1Z38_15005 [Desulfotignum sp.]
MNRKSEQVDFCTNCLNMEDCFYFKNKKEPVHFCEEFTCKDPAVSVNDIERLKRAEAMSLSMTNPGLFDDCGKPAPLVK